MYVYHDLGEQKLQQEISDKINRDYFFVFQCFNLICKMRIKKIKQTIKKQIHIQQIKQNTTCLRSFDKQQFLKYQSCLIQVKLFTCFFDTL